MVADFWKMKNAMLRTLLVVFCWMHFSANSQTTANKPPSRPVFRSTRLINFHTVESLPRGSLDFRISHRLGTFKDPLYNFFGFDGPAAIKLAFDYSVTDKFTIGTGRSNYGKMWEGFIKYQFLCQTEDNSMPLSFTAFSSINITSRPQSKTNEFEKFGARISYVYQFMLARNFGNRISVQLAPTWIHFNQVNATSDNNDQFVLATMARLRLNRTFLLIGEYGWRITKLTNPTTVAYRNSASAGIEIQTVGHSFQFAVTNSEGMNESQFLALTASSFLRGEIRIGFNISRVFSLAKK